MNLEVLWGCGASSKQNISCRLHNNCNVLELQMKWKWRREKIMSKVERIDKWNKRGRYDAIAFVCALTNKRCCGQIVQYNNINWNKNKWQGKERRESVSEWWKGSCCRSIFLCRKWLLVSAVRLALWQWRRKCYWHPLQLRGGRLACWHGRGRVRRNLYSNASTFLVLWKEWWEDFGL